MNETKVLKSILYTDGGCYPNPGDSGSGCHGFIYDVDGINKKSTSKYKPTVSGYLSTNELKNMDVDTIEFVSPVTYIDFVIPSQLDGGTNNTAECDAISMGVIKLINDYPEITDIIVKSDSTVAISIFNKTMRFNKVVESAIDVSSLEKMFELITLLKKTKVNVEMVKVKGHSIFHGNNSADRLATMAVDAKKQGLSTPTYQYSLPKDYNNPGTRAHPLFTNSTLFLFLTTNYNIKGMYNFISLKMGDGGETEAHIGVNGSNRTTYGTFIPAEPIDLLEHTIHRLNEAVDGMKLPATIRLSNLYSKTSRLLMSLFGKGSMTSMNGVVSIGKRQNNDNESVVAHVLDEPNMLVKANKLFRFTSDIYDQYKNPRDKYEFIDITDRIYTSVTKTGAKKVKIPFRQATITIGNDKFKLYPKEDLPDASQMNKVKGNPPKLFLVVYRTKSKSGKEVIQYGTLLDLDKNGVMVTSTPSSYKLVGAI